mmetsp:Transcript_43637/g.104037  ORF Transcript_43637/g.104037 Transcript_43637/m.104037 type:complete len:227 (-) Transcript_43637:1092-1772(-)
MVPDAILHLYFVLPVVREVVRHEGDEAKLASAFAVPGRHQAQDVPSICPEEELHESTHVPCTRCLKGEREHIGSAGPAAAVRAATTEVQVGEGPVRNLARGLTSRSSDLPAVFAEAILSRHTGRISTPATAAIRATSCGNVWPRTAEVLATEISISSERSSKPVKGSFPGSTGRTGALAGSACRDIGRRDRCCRGHWCWWSRGGGWRRGIRTREALRVPLVRKLAI